MAPEQLLGSRNDRRSDLFALGSLLYFFSTGVRPFGEGETMRWMRRRLWRDPTPPRKLRPDYPPWLQEIVLRCLEIQPAWRHPSAAQLAFDLSHRSEVKLTARSEKLKRDPCTTVLRRRFNTDVLKPRPKPALAAQLAATPIVMVAVDLDEASAPISEALRLAATRLIGSMPSARLACVNVLKQGRVTLDTTLDEQGHNKHIDRMVALRNWAVPLKLEEERLTVHVLEAVDPAAAILDFLRANGVDHLLIGARQKSLMRALLGSVSAKVSAEAPCTVTVVRPARADVVSEADTVARQGPAREPAA
jgi:nucleotide-binding universal stress UspA family protein